MSARTVARRRAWARAVVVAAGLGAAGVARADALDLAWSAPAECPSGDAVRAAVARLVSSGAAPLRARVTVAREGERYAADVETDGGARRALRGGSCTDVTEAVAVVLALAIDPDARIPAEPSAILIVPSPTVTAARVEPTPVAQPAMTRPPVAVGPSVGVDGTLLPRATPTVGGRAALLFSRATVAVTGAYLAPQDAESSRFRAWGFGAQACFARRLIGARWEICGGLDAGRLAGVGTGIAHPSSASAAWADVAAEIAGRWAIGGPVGLRFGGGGALVVAGRHPFVIDGLPGSVHRPGLVSPRASLTLDVVF